MYHSRLWQTMSIKSGCGQLIDHENGTEYQLRSTIRELCVNLSPMMVNCQLQIPWCSKNSMMHVQGLIPLLSIRQHLNYDEREDYQNCSVLCSAQSLQTSVNSSDRWTSTCWFTCTLVFCIFSWLWWVWLAVDYLERLVSMMEIDINLCLWPKGTMS